MLTTDASTILYIVSVYRYENMTKDVRLERWGVGINMELFPK